MRYHRKIYNGNKRNMWIYTSYLQADQKNKQYEEIITYGNFNNYCRFLSTI